MGKKEEKWMEELRRQLEGLYDPLGEETIEDEKLLAVFREIKDYEASTRPAGSHWPENLIASILGLEWVELKKSGDGASVEEVLSDLLDTLTPRESKVIELFYKDEKGLIEIGQEFNVSYAMVRSVLAKGTRKLCQPARAKRLAALVEKSDKEPVIRTRERTLKRWLDVEESEGEENNGNAEDEDFIKHLFDAPDGEDDKTDDED